MDVEHDLKVTGSAGSRVWPVKHYIDMHRRSLEDPEGFWSEQARKLD